jgi:hypothetical protein
VVDAVADMRRALELDPANAQNPITLAQMLAMEGMNAATQKEIVSLMRQAVNNGYPRARVKYHPSLREFVSEIPDDGSTNASKIPGRRYASPSTTSSLSDFMHTLSPPHE